MARCWIAEGRSNLHESRRCQLPCTNPGRTRDSPVGVDTTEELRAELHVVEVAAKETRQLLSLLLHLLPTYSTTWSQLREKNESQHPAPPKTRAGTHLDSMTASSGSASPPAAAAGAAAAGASVAGASGLQRGKNKDEKVCQRMLLHRHRYESLRHAAPPFPSSDTPPPSPNRCDRSATLPEAKRIFEDERRCSLCGRCGSGGSHNGQGRGADEVSGRAVGGKGCWAVCCCVERRGKKTSAERKNGRQRIG